MKELDEADRAHAMHEAHQTWRSDHEAWRDDVQAWSREHQEVIADLEAVATALRDLQRDVGDHGERLQTHEQALQEHEHELAELEALCAREHVAPRTADHDDLGAQHDREREAHARLKARQHELLAVVRKLKRIVAPPRA